MSIDVFYKNNGPASFIKNMTTFLKIPEDKMRIISIIEGSVLINFEILLDQVTK